MIGIIESFVGNIVDGAIGALESTLGKDVGTSSSPDHIELIDKYGNQVSYTKDK
jgi:hypothetical protein